MYFFSLLTNEEIKVTQRLIIHGGFIRRLCINHLYEWIAYALIHISIIVGCTEPHFSHICSEGNKMSSSLYKVQLPHELKTYLTQFVLDCFSVSSNDNHCTIHTINNFDKSFWKLQTRKNCSFAWTVSLILLNILLNHIFRLQKICMTLMNKILESDYGKEFFNQNTY